MNKDLKHDIILIVISFAALIIGLSPIIISEVNKGLKIDHKFSLSKINFSIKNGKSGTYICTKTEKEEDTTTESIVTLSYENDTVKTLKEVETQTSDPDQVEMSYAFSKLFLAPFNMIDGVEMKIRKDNNKLITESLVDYDKLDSDKIKKIYESFAEEDSNDKKEENKLSFEIKKGTKIEDVIKDNFGDYECKKQK